MNARSYLSLIIVFSLVPCWMGCAPEDNSSKSPTGSTVVSAHKFAYDEIDVVELEAATVLSAESFLSSPRTVHAVQNWLVVGDAKGDTVLHILNSENGDRVGSWGSRGRGPTELGSAWELIADPQPQNRGVWVYDYQPRRLMFFDVTQYVSGKSISDPRLISLKTDGAVMSVDWLTRSRLAATGLFAQGRIQMIDEGGQFLKPVGPSPLPDSPGPVPTRQFIYRTIVRAHPNGSVVALATRHFDRIEIVGLEDGHVVRVTGPSNFGLEYQVVQNESGDPSARPTESIRTGYTALDVDEDFIYGLYSGRTGENSNYADKIHVVDWDGNVQRVLNLGKDVFHIDVNREEGFIYAIRDYPEPAVVRYAFPTNDPGEDLSSSE